MTSDPISVHAPKTVDRWLAQMRFAKVQPYIPAGSSALERRVVTVRIPYYPLQITHTSHAHGTQNVFTCNDYRIYGIF